MVDERYKYIYILLYPIFLIFIDLQSILHIYIYIIYPYACGNTCLSSFSSVGRGLQVQLSIQVWQREVAGGVFAQ